MAQRRWVSSTLLVESAMFSAQRERLQADSASAVLRSAALDVPPTFDGIATWAAYTPPVKNQCNCGGCWAFATSACLAMRINIWTKNTVHVDLSPAKMIYCNWGGDTEYALVKRAFDENLDFATLADQIRDTVLTVGCSGETLIGAWQYLYRYGGTSEECHPYSSDVFDLCQAQIGQALPSCAEVSGASLDVCQDGTPERQYRAGGFYMVSDTALTVSDNERAIRREVWKYGPVTTGMRVYEDLFDWDGTGVYRWDGRAPLTGGHAVVILGWGTLDGVKYWQVRNTWGAAWGDAGNFRIVRGENHCELEANVLVGYPDMPLASRYLLSPRLFTPQDVFLRNVWPYDYSGYNVSAIVDILLGRKGRRLIDPLYTPEMIPDFKTMVAARPHAIVYPYATSNIHWGLFVFALLACGLLLAAVVWQARAEK
jgi:hypothetical protein